LSAANGSAPWYGLEVWQTKGEIGDVNGDGFDDIVLSNQNQTLVLRSVLARVLDGQSSDNPNMFVSGKSIQVGMDENGAVTSVHNFNKECLRFEDLESTNKDDGGESEDESSNVLVAAGGVEVTTRDAAVAGVGLLIGIGGSVIGRGKRLGQLTGGKGKDNLDLEDVADIIDEIDLDSDLDLDKPMRMKDEPMLKDLFVQDEYQVNRKGMTDSADPLLDDYVED